jgi:hypothetical protein
MKSMIPSAAFDKAQRCLLMRYLTVLDAKIARKSIIFWATRIDSGFYLLTPVIGYGATLFTGEDVISALLPARLPGLLPGYGPRR